MFQQSSNKRKNKSIISDIESGKKIIFWTYGGQYETFLGPFYFCGKKQQRLKNFNAFCSHSKHSGGKYVHQIYNEAKLQHNYYIWYDNDEKNDPNPKNMIEGVIRSDVFLILLTKDIFSRPWCQFEICANS